MDKYVEVGEASECMLPSQLVRGRVLSAEEQLAFAVLASGIEDASGGPGASRGSGSRARCWAEAVDWMENDDWVHPFSFISLCELFGFDAVGIRRRVLGGEARVRAGQRLVRDRGHQRGPLRLRERA